MLRHLDKAPMDVRVPRETAGARVVEREALAEQARRRVPVPAVAVRGHLAAMLLSDREDHNLQPTNGRFLRPLQVSYTGIHSSFR